MVEYASLGTRITFHYLREISLSLFIKIKPNLAPRYPINRPTDSRLTPSSTGILTGHLALFLC
jgi:hypothetical protein